MKQLSFILPCTIIIFLMMTSCSPKDGNGVFTGASGEVKLITVDPGHFHAALVLKTMYPQVNNKVRVFAPEGQDLENYLRMVKSYNTRDDNPTSWEPDVYTGNDWLEKGLKGEAGNVMVTAGNNARKTDYIYRFIDAGINVLSDKPMVITPENFSLLKEAFQKAEEKNILLYDIMTERSEINIIMQRELSLIEPVFGVLIDGSTEEPAITKESVHYFYKYVSGSPLRRPPWYFDVQQQGEGIVDVTTHLVDLIQWGAFPDEIIDYKTDIEMISARRWPTDLTIEQFKRVTQVEELPEYLNKYLDGGLLRVYANGEMDYRLKGKYARVSVIWDYQAPEGAGDTHYSIMRGTKSNLIIQQGENENYKPTLYVEAKDKSNAPVIESELNKAINGAIASKYPGMEVEKLDEGFWRINIPDHYKVGHEAHFGEVMERFLGYLVDGKLPDWEVPNMISKYYTNMKALEISSK